jgi:hypothetical protein
MVRPGERSVSGRVFGVGFGGELDETPSSAGMGSCSRVMSKATGPGSKSVPYLFGAFERFVPAGLRDCAMSDSYYRLVSTGTAKRHVRPHLASGHASKVPPKQ